MAREIKRVPLDFAWPQDKVWDGYKNPFYAQSINCDQCDGRGNTPELKLLEDRWYGYAPFKPEDRGSVPWCPEDKPIREFAERQCQRDPMYYGSSESSIVRNAQRLCNLWNACWSHHLNEQDVAALLEANRLHDFTRNWDGGKWVKIEPAPVPTPRQVNEWSLQGMGHDSINCWAVLAAEAKRLGYETECKKCGGDGTLWPSEAIKQRCEAWESTHPPKGDGYVVWPARIQPRCYERPAIGFGGTAAAAWASVSIESTK